MLLLLIVQVMVMESEAERFFEYPDFHIDTALEYDESEPFISNVIGTEEVLVSSLLPKHRLYAVCKQRYWLLAQQQDWLEKPSIRMVACLIFAEALFWLSDLYGCLSFLLKLVSFCVSDSRLDRLIRILRELCTMDEVEQCNIEDESEDEEGIMVYHLSEPTVCPLACIDMFELEEISKTWGDYKIIAGSNNIYERYIAVTTNELEDVFQVDQVSFTRLVRCAFSQTLIGSVPSSSKIQSKDNIVSMLNKTYVALETVCSLFCTEDDFTEVKICELHDLLMKGDNFDVEKGDDGEVMCMMVIPSGMAELVY